MRLCNHLQKMLLAALRISFNDHILLKHCLNIAIRRGLLVSNPASKVPVPNPHNERDRVLSEDEWTRLYEVAASHLRPILLVTYHLGQRLGEILNLTWDRVDLQRGFITSRAIDTKTKKPRQVPLTPAVRSVLSELAKIRRLNTNHVFLYEELPITSVKTAFKRAKRVAGVKNFRFHDLRHCPATNLRRAGVDTATAMKMWVTSLRRCGNAITLSTRRTYNWLRLTSTPTCNLTLD